MSEGGCVARLTLFLWLTPGPTAEPSTEEYAVHEYRNIETLRPVLSLLIA